MLELETILRNAGDYSLSISDPSQSIHIIYSNPCQQLLAKNVYDANYKVSIWNLLKKTIITSKIIFEWCFST